MGRKRHKSRPQADRELYGGKLRQHNFKGMCLDKPPSSLDNGYVARAENVIFKDGIIYPRSGIKEQAATIGGLNYFHSFAKPARSIGTGSCFYHRGDKVLMGDDYLTGVFDYATILHYRNGDLGTTVSFGAADGNSRFARYKNGSVLFSQDGLFYCRSGGCWKLNARNPLSSGYVYNGGGTGVKYRYLFTFSRITDSADDPFSTVVATDRLADNAVIESESGTNAKAKVVSGTPYVKQASDTDYLEHEIGSAISPSNPQNIYTFPSRSAFSDDSDATSNWTDTTDTHWTHLTVWRTRNTEGIDPSTNLSFDGNIYGWICDIKRKDIYDISSSVLDDVTDEILTARIQSGLVLKSRFFQPLPNCEEGDIDESFIYCTQREAINSKVYYSSIESPELAGYYFPGAQFKTMNEPITVIRSIGEKLYVIMQNSTFACTKTSWKSVSDYQFIPQLDHFYSVSDSIGINDHATFCGIGGNNSIALCSDSSVRVLSESGWGSDLAGGLVRAETEKIVQAKNDARYGDWELSGSWGAYYRGAYYLVYSKVNTDTYLTTCLRLGLEVGNGEGWSFVTGLPPLSFKAAGICFNDSEGVDRFFIVDHTTDTAYLVDTFANSATSNNTRESTDNGTAISCVVKFPEIVPEEAGDVLQHQESYVTIRNAYSDYDSESSQNYLMVLKGYGWLSSSNKTIVKPQLVETVTPINNGTFTSFHKELIGDRIQLGLEITGNNWSLENIESRIRVLEKTRTFNTGTDNDVESTTGSFSFHNSQHRLESNLAFWLKPHNFSYNSALNAKNRYGFYTKDLISYGGSLLYTQGPDLVEDSAIVLPVASNVNTVNMNKDIDNFAISFWVKGSSVSNGAAGPSNAMIHITTELSDIYVNITGSDSITVTIAGEFVDFTSTGVNFDDDEWHNIFIVKKDGETDINLYVDGALSDSDVINILGGELGLAETIRFGDPVTPAEYHDIRLYAMPIGYGSSLPRAGDISYYYNDKISNRGLHNNGFV